MIQFMPANHSIKTWYPFNYNKKHWSCWWPIWSVYYSTIQISFSDLKKEIGNHSPISNFHFQFENENQKIGLIFWFSFIIWNWKSENWTYFLIFIFKLKMKNENHRVISDFLFQIRKGNLNCGIVHAPNIFSLANRSSKYINVYFTATF